ncbi:MAG: hypothetical protein M0006_13345 [Magnetospirillum sp.]|nr:hypothetical protein [Magnetospirillum sp.]
MAPPRRIPPPANDNSAPLRARLMRAAAAAVLVAIAVAAVALKG